MEESDITIVIMGASGDLTRRKLIPALFNLDCKDRLPKGLRIVGVARSEYSDDQFRQRMWEGAREFGELAALPDDWRNFASRLFYVRGDVGSLDHLQALQQRLEELEDGGRPANRLFYLSIAPHLYGPAIENLGASEIAREDGRWCRVVIEKPFGQDLKSAQALNRVINKRFNESQIYRIDHYLGKETVQNLMAFRFANIVFEPLWNCNYIDNVQLTVSESVGVGDRAGYYDQSGVVRDMVQNHLLQLVTMVAMDPPRAVDAESLRDRKVEVLKCIRRWRPEDAVKHSIAGQYKGYLDEKAVNPDSTTATYAALRLYVDNWRWNGVPFYLRTGKAMASKVSEIVLQFKVPPNVIFSLGEYPDLTSNMLGLCLQPDEGAHLTLGAKVPDQPRSIQSVDMEFHYDSAFKGKDIPEAYERLLQDALAGDSSLFIRNDHIEEAWRVVDPLLQSWEELRSTPVHIYEHGSWGPAAADQMLAQDNRVWLQVCGDHDQLDRDAA